MSLARHAFRRCRRFISMRRTNTFVVSCQLWLVRIVIRSSTAVNNDRSAVDHRRTSPTVELRNTVSSPTQSHYGTSVVAASSSVAIPDTISWVA